MEEQIFIAIITNTRRDLEISVRHFGWVSNLFVNFITGIAYVLMRVQYPKCACGPYCKLGPICNGVYIFVEVSFYISACNPFNVSIAILNEYNLFTTCISCMYH